MKVTAIYVYPIKALRGIRLDEARLGPQGVQHDRRFMLCRVQDGELAKVQLSQHPECSLFAQDIVGDEVHVRYLPPDDPLVPSHQHHGVVLKVPLSPDTSALPKAQVSLHQSLVHAYRMGSLYDDWFSACFGFETALVYIGDERRPVLGTFAPPTDPPPAKGWLSALPGRAHGDAPWLAFSDVAPFLVTSEQSLRDVSARLAEGHVDMFKFRPNIVVDGEAEFDEDFWSELSVNGEAALTLTKMCGRCSSINVDYETGRPAHGERGLVLKKLMADRRIDSGNKYAPVFGKYGFLARQSDGLVLRVGDDVAVTKRSVERPVWDWPAKTKSEARFYHY